MRLAHALLPALLLCCAGPIACDCAGPVHVDDASLRPRADASGDAAVLDAAAADTWPADRGPADLARNDTVRVDTAILDAILVDSAHADAASVDTAGGDAAILDSTILDTAPADTAPADTAIADTAIADTAIADTAFVDSAMADSFAGDATVVDASIADAGPAVEDCGAAGLCLALTWNSDQGDLDLHLSFNGGRWCSDDACYFANCADDASYHVDWDQSGGSSSADPVIYHSRRIGHGPEILRLEDPLQATYTAAVHYTASAPSDVTAVVELWSLGVKAATQAHTLAPGAFWELGDILVGASSVALTPASRLCGSGQWMCGDLVHACPAE